ncbi:hypothetical protein [Rhodanobacter panaciterrae]|uniref:hypothetical protein n=1 Tax=Rhodanobacter panaciterrae TaxID=490572 RepID=UPI0016748FF2|nr:hypothetical protein [Rhodanobacter panaciterrae]
MELPRVPCASPFNRPVDIVPTQKRRHKAGVRSLLLVVSEATDLIESAATDGRFLILVLRSRTSAQINV